MFKKRAGTSGIRGQFYETKLLSLLLFKAQHNEEIEEFYLGTNVDEIGAFDDICFKAKVQDHDRPVAIFIQAKHRENDDRVLTLNNKNNLAKYFESFMKIKLKFDPKNKDVFFNGTFDETECIFVLYTTEQGDLEEYYEREFADLLNDLIATGGLGSQPIYSNEDVKFLCKIAMKEEIRTLATRFAKYIYSKNNDINDVHILRYHVILAEKVINVSDIQPKGHRIGTFRLEFFAIKDEYLVLFRDKLNQEVLKLHVTKTKSPKIEDNAIKDLVTGFFSSPTDFVLGELIFRNVISYKSGRLEFVDKVPRSLSQQLEKVHLPRSMLDQAIFRAVNKIIKNLEFHLPTSFGNKDLMVRNEKRLSHLTKCILDMLNKNIDSKIVIISETDNTNGLLQLNGGLGSAVGNILIYDEKTELFKFTDNYNSLEKNAKTLFENLYKEMKNLDEFRFDIRVKDFPKLSFECSDQDLVKEFFDKLVFFTNQEDESGVGKLLKDMIDDLEGADKKNFRVKSEAIFQNFHELVQKWWMEPKKAEYLTKNTDLYQRAKTTIVDDLMINVISTMYKTEMKDVECTFKDSSTITLSMDNPSRNIIVTDITRLTFLKLTQSLAGKEYVALDLKYMLNLQTNDFKALITELKNTNKEKYVIIISENLQNTSTMNRNLQEIAKAVNLKNIYLITNKTFSDTMKNFFTKAAIINDEGNSLFDLNEDSRNSILSNAKFIFQGQEVVDPKIIIDDKSMEFIKGDVFNKILRNETIVIGESLELPNRPFELLSYDSKQMRYEIKDLYINRRVKDNKMLRTLHDIDDDIVLITAKPGMGKSTLLSYLSIRTKELNEKLWLMRINLLDYSKKFSKWKKEETVIDTLELLNFMCEIILKNKTVQASDITIALSDNGEAYLEERPEDEWVTFELEMYLHFFNTSKIIFLFDGFDEICPNYENEVISFLNSVKNCSQNHKIWITSRPYNVIKKVLQSNFGISEPYELEPFSDTEQEIYFDTFWRSNITINELNEAQLDNLKGFIDFMTNRLKSIPNDNFIRLNKPQNYLLNKVYFHFIVFLKNEMRILPMDFPLDCNYRDMLNYSTILSHHTQYLFVSNVGERGINDMLEFVGTPLHLYLIAEYFLNGITDVSKNAKQWDLDINTYAIYESFLESKLKKIRFQDKNKMDIDNPDVLETYNTVRKDFIDMHKKLAAYVIFQRNGQEIFNSDELKEIESLITRIKTGSEKTGLIYSVTGDLPQFIHMTFAEYFAVEFVSDSLKEAKTREKQHEICNFIIDTMLFESPLNVLHIMDQKLKMDSDLAAAIENNKDYIFDSMLAQRGGCDNTGHDHVKSSLFESISKNLNNFLSIFTSTLECKINKDNLDDFIEFIGKTGFLKNAATMRYEDLILTVLKVVRKIDISKWRMILSDPHYYYCDGIDRNTEVPRLLRHHIFSFFTWPELNSELSMMYNGAA